MTETVIYRGRVITAVDDYRANILIKDGKIDTIAREIHPDTAIVHDANDSLVLLGGVDVHTPMEVSFSGDRLREGYRGFLCLRLP